MKTLLTIRYCPELNTYAVHNGQRERIIIPSDFEKGGPLEQFAPVFEQARAAVVEGRSVAGIHVEV